LFGVTTKGSELSFCDSIGDLAVAIGSRKLLFTKPTEWQSYDPSAMSLESATSQVTGAYINADFARTGCVKADR